MLIGVLPSSGIAQAASADRLFGTVVDREGRPLDRAEVRWLRGGNVVVVRTDSTGRFSFGDASAGDHRISIRRLGYVPRTLLHAAAPPGAAGVAVPLAASPALLAALRVTSPRDESRGKLLEFERRRVHPNRLGHFLGPAELARGHHPLLSDFLRGIPGVTVEPTTAIIGNVVRFRGCRPMVWIDGMRMADVEVDEVVQARDVAAIEVYVSLAGSPGRYRDLTRPCGSLVVWMKT